MAAASQSGGVVFVGPVRLSLRKARETALYFTDLAAATGDRAIAIEALALAEAHNEAHRWRRASGWADPYAADRAAPIQSQEGN
ncbi:MAG TPA: hypothetical protein VG248_03620 [Caulobacteraceae bacterium]|jgi:hypothetical protein|nr:hypothetical protein [Caulobacteraceae bacterium]